jgi:hypothetical protein
MYEVYRRFRAAYYFLIWYDSPKRRHPSIPNDRYLHTDHTPDNMERNIYGSGTSACGRAETEWNTPPPPTPPPRVYCRCCNIYEAERAWSRCRSRCGSRGGARSLSGPPQITAVSLSAAYELNGFRKNVVQPLAIFLFASMLPFTFSYSLTVTLGWEIRTQVRN